jgi:hypothetical protein
LNCDIIPFFYAFDHCLPFSSVFLLQFANRRWSLAILRL